MARVVVTINPRTSEVSYDVDGIIGTSCKTITDLLQQNQELLEEREKESFAQVEELPEYLENL